MMGDRDSVRDQRGGRGFGERSAWTRTSLGFGDEASLEQGLGSFRQNIMF